MTRVAVADVGTNSTRLLVADVEGTTLRPVERRSRVTRLGEGVDATGRLADAAMDRVRAVLADYRAIVEATGAEHARAVLTSAVRDADNGEAFVAEVRDRFGFDARELSGDEEARLTYLGATSARDRRAPTLVIDVGGGSTELVVGEGDALRFHVSTQAGVVRQSERHLHADPPRAEELAALTGDVRAIFGAAVPDDVARLPTQAIGVAGSPTSLASIELGLEPYDPTRVEGHVLRLDRIVALRDRLATMTVDQRRAIPGLHPDRASVIVAGTVLLVEAMRRFGLDELEVSERDLLHGVALSTPLEAAR